MNLYFIKGILFSGIVLFFWLLFYWMEKQSLVGQIIENTRKNLEQQATKQLVDQRRNLILQQERKGLLYQTEKRLMYSGISRRFPLVTAQVWILFRVLAGSACYLAGMILQMGILKSLCLVLAFEFAVYVLVNQMMQKNFNKTDETLLKLLDFLGNYSVTTSEITWILSQIADYLEEPVKGVLEECYLEAQVTGDYSVALLYMAEKLQHPKFQELVRNLEISIRYSADLTVLVAQSRRSIGEYMRMRQERKALTREAWVNILILGAMTLVILKAVEALLGLPMNDLLFHTLPGMLCVGVILVILVLFYAQVKVLEA